MCYGQYYIQNVSIMLPFVRRSFDLIFGAIQQHEITIRFFVGTNFMPLC
jgi:hypothetical protein